MAGFQQKLSLENTPEGVYTFVNKPATGLMPGGADNNPRNKMFIKNNHTHAPLPMIRTSILLLAFFVVLPGCDIEQREKELEQKALVLQQKEEELQARETALSMKEDELTRMTKALDSTRQDSTFIYDPSLIGLWSVKMTCTQTTCPGSAVGDTKTEQWEISYQGHHILAQALVSDTLTRVYQGIYTGNTIELVEERSGVQAQPATRMIVRLRKVSSRGLEGQREIIREGECKIIYALQMDKQMNRTALKN